MVDNQGKTPNNFGDLLRIYMKKHRYAIRKYADLVNESHSTIQNILQKDTATIKRVSDMVQYDPALIKVVEEHFNNIAAGIEAFSINQVEEPQATYQTKPNHQITNKEIINLQRELIQLQQEVIKLNKEIIKLSK